MKEQPKKNVLKHYLKAMLAFYLVLAPVFAYMSYEDDRLKCIGAYTGKTTMSCSEKYFQYRFKNYIADGLTWPLYLYNKYK